MDARLDLYWIPVGAGQHVVRVGSGAYEALVAAVQRRGRCALYHSALVATLDGMSTYVEMTPAPDDDGARRGVVATGAVGTKWLAGLRVFRYEVRRWRGGAIPDLNFAVASPVTITTDRDDVQRVLDLIALVPTPVWGRDEMQVGEMWNSNSVVSWALACGGLLDAAGRFPAGGRAPGWDAGVRVARRYGAARAGRRVHDLPRARRRLLSREPAGQGA